MSEVAAEGHQEDGPSVNGDHEEEVKPMDFPLAKQAEIVMTDYIRQSLAKVATAEGFVDYELDVDHGSSIGDGFVGIMLKVIIREIYGDRRLTVLAKIPPQSTQRRQVMGAMMLFEREVYLYNVLLPEFVTFQREKKIPEAMGFYNFPKVYYADFDEELDDAIIIMEDLRDRGHMMWSKFEPANYEHTKLVVSALGRLHAISFGLKARKPELFEKCRQINDVFLKAFGDTNFQRVLERSVVGIAECLDEDDEMRKAKVLKMNEDIFQLLTDCLDGESTEPYAVINHGDCWTNNFMFHYTKRGTPDDIVLIDWQISRYCSPVIDLVYYFFICTDKETRTRHFDEFLSIYHHSLRDLLNRLGGDTAAQFPFTALLRQLKKFGKFGVVMAAIAVPMLQTKNEELVDMDFMAEKLQNADPQEHEKIMKEMMQKSSSFAKTQKRLRDVVHDAIRYGYL